VRHVAVLVALGAAIGCRSGASGTATGPSSTVPPAPSAGCKSGEAAALVGVARDLTVAGEVRHYLIDAPAGPADAPRPLVLVFHGFRDSAAGVRAFAGFAKRAAAGELIAIHVDGRDDVQLLGGVGRGWDIAPEETRDAAVVSALLDAVEVERCVDRRRVYATGFSNGGFFSSLLACRLADRLAAVAPVAGARSLDDCRPAAPIPIMFFHGRRDPVVPPRLTAAAAAWWRRANHCSDLDPGGDDEDGCRAARACAADVVVCSGPQRHSWPSNASDLIWEFFRNHPRTG
jgi:polyhydroxybutyrate depolymerase